MPQHNHRTGDPKVNAQVAEKLKTIKQPPAPAPRKDFMSRASDTIVEGLKGFERVKKQLRQAAGLPEEVGPKGR